MIGNRLKIAKRIAKKRFKHWYPDFNLEDCYSFSKKEALGFFRKTNTRCSCHGCRNPRHSMHYNEKEKRTFQEKKSEEAFKQVLIGEC